MILIVEQNLIQNVSTQRFFIDRRFSSVVDKIMHSQTSNGYTKHVMIML